MLHIEFSQHDLRTMTQRALSAGQLTRCSDLINILGWYGTQQAEDIYLRLFKYSLIGPNNSWIIKDFHK